MAAIWERVFRMTGVHQDTIRRFALKGGGGCQRLHDRMVRDLTCTVIKVDEQWSFITNNLCRVIRTLRITPAMQAGLVNHVWDLGEMMDAALAELPVEPLRAKPLRHPEPVGASRALPNGRGILRVIDGARVRYFLARKRLANSRCGMTSRLTNYKYCVDTVCLSGTSSSRII